MAYGVTCVFSWSASRIFRRPRSGPADQARDEGVGRPVPDDWDGRRAVLAFLDPPVDSRHIGSLGPYQIVEVIGRGGMGVVLKGSDSALSRVVAIKVLAPELWYLGSARLRFAREARAAASVAHDHVVAIHAVDSWKGLPYLVMQYVAGKSLQGRIESDGPLAVREVLRIGMQVASGLAAAHAQGLVHRDIKPANILLENGIERVKITDFGLARAADDASISQSGVAAGTPHYMAPEQARCEPIDPRVDLFGLGGVMYAMCTGTRRSGPRPRWRSSVASAKTPRSRSGPTTPRFPRGSRQSSPSSWPRIRPHGSRRPLRSRNFSVSAWSTSSGLRVRRLSRASHVTRRSPAWGGDVGSRRSGFWHLSPGSV